jgi:AcrR family transcriptional regulator
MAKRGEALRDHILWAAKDVFLEVGFERASMDEVASRAGTSKRSLYAHFENKERLFLEVVELVRGLFLGRLKDPAGYSSKPTEALVLFCGRYLDALLYERSIRMCQVTIAESSRFPKGAEQFYDVVFNEALRRLSAYIRTAFRLSAKASADAASRLLAQVVYPQFTRAIFGLEPLIHDLGDGSLSPSIDLKPIRRAVTEMIESFAD